MYTNLNAAVYFLYGLIAVNLVLALVLYCVKLHHIRIRKTRERFHRKFRDYLVYIQTNVAGGERLRTPPMKMSAVESNALQDRLNDMIEALSGEPRDQLIELCERLGFVRAHLNRLRGRSYRERVDAAYHLGCMRAKEAVPALLEMLRHHRLDSTLFVIARAVAKCAQDAKDVKEMLRIMTTKGKSFPDLLADIVEEARIDRTALFAELLQEPHPSLVRIAFAGLNGASNPNLAAAVYRCIDSEHADIQEKAIELYLKSSAMLPKHVVARLLEHPSANVRLLTAGALRDLSQPTYADAMRSCLLDTDPRVVAAGAEGLLGLGLPGMELFCASAWEQRERGEGTALQDRIEEELAALSERLDTLDGLTRYNALLYAYEKTFGRNKRIYRVV
ncbi:hypothetical protein FE782_08540 [Paenibacillus antri]|uniref:HEAT repeat domain-containing protein n=1 Tax=Paenibacillus antri TaxID=2582848 RepID=A0A5R9GGZ4_9BACL|nr:hypothetical protein [Paenibacillus antri]TLS52668.1 hypothetical protein FE782_08540 [Paenibacillus antri]